MLASAYDGSQSVTGWLMSEKMDGIRAVFHPEARELRTRTGKAIHAPPEFLAGFPAALMLDGELFIAYGQFDRVSGIVRSGSANASMARWAGVRYVVFDAPAVRAPFTGRLAAAAAALAGVTHAAVLAHERVASPAALAAFHAGIEAKGGEGVMVRDPGGAYEQKRSKLLLKVKNFMEEEATVTGHERGRAAWPAAPARSPAASRTAPPSAAAPAWMTPRARRRRRSAASSPSSSLSAPRTTSRASPSSRACARTCERVRRQHDDRRRDHSARVHVSSQRSCSVRSNARCVHL
jgi:hypothetical protein